LRNPLKEDFFKEREMKEVNISSEYIKLDQFLKYMGIASTGGHAKYLITESCVSVNGHISHERGKKLREGDIVKITISEENINKTYRIHNK
jgi:ribosome-associated protein